MQGESQNNGYQFDGGKLREGLWHRGRRKPARARESRIHFGNDGRKILQTVYSPANSP
jgi:hypothetical protein